MSYIVKFPELAKLMAVHEVTKKDLSKIIGKSPSQVSYKLEGRVEFKLSDMQKTTLYFRNKEIEKEGKSDLNSDKIFYSNDNYSYLNDNIEKG